MQGEKVCLPRTVHRPQVYPATLTFAPHVEIELGNFCKLLRYEVLGSRHGTVDRCSLYDGLQRRESECSLLRMLAQNHEILGP